MSWRFLREILKIYFVNLDTASLNLQGYCAFVARLKVEKLRNTFAPRVKG